jgi:hypothetical protein
MDDDGGHNGGIAPRRREVGWDTMRIPPCCLALAVLGTPLHAQALEDRITDLFIFGEVEEVLFLGRSGGADNRAIQVHGVAALEPGGVQYSASGWRAGTSPATEIPCTWKDGSWTSFAGGR